MVSLDHLRGLAIFVTVGRNFDNDLSFLMRSRTGESQQRSARRSVRKRSLF
jgi:hypothetical protein